MKIKLSIYLILAMLIHSCSNKNEADNNSIGGFSENDTQELVNILDSSEAKENRIVEETTIGEASSYSDSIWQLVNGNLTHCPGPISKKIDNKDWSFCKHDNGLILYQVKYIQDNIGFTEKYLIRDGELIYAVEWEKRTADMKDDEATYWNCEYIIKGNQVVDYMSLGMGKTEDNSFNSQDIITLWNSRKEIFSKLKN